jgi:hypothetical protein
MGDGVIGSPPAFGAVQSRFESESPSHQARDAKRPDLRWTWMLELKDSWNRNTAGTERGVASPCLTRWLRSSSSPRVRAP